MEENHMTIKKFNKIYNHSAFLTITILVIVFSLSAINAANQTADQNRYYENNTINEDISSAIDNAKPISARKVVGASGIVQLNFGFTTTLSERDRPLTPLTPLNYGGFTTTLSERDGNRFRLGGFGSETNGWGGGWGGGYGH
jgi:hypothetical protein